MPPKAEDLEIEFSELEDEVTDLAEFIAETKNIAESLRLEEKGVDSKLKARLSRLDDTYRIFTEKLSRAKRYGKGLKQDVSRFDKVRTEVRQDYYEIIAMADSLSSPDVSNIRLNTSTNTTHMTPSFKLPTINLPTFDGNISAWPVFKDTYLALIHNNEDLAPIQKYHYLRSSLKSNALQAIATIPLTELEYPQAWENLLKRYENKRLQAVNHLTKIFGASPMNKIVTFSALQQLTNVVIESVTAFQNLKLEQESGFILMTYILRLLSPILREKFETKYATDNRIPTLQNLMQFIHEQELMMQSEACASGCVVSVPPLQTETRRVLYTQENRSESLPSSSPCLACRQNHRIYQCPQFQTLTPSERTKLIQPLKLCYNCLANHHTTKQCRSRTSCRECGKRHHTLLHEIEVVQSNTEPETSVPTQVDHTHLATALQLIEDKEPRSVLSSAVQGGQSVILATVRARIRDGKGRLHPLRMIVDCGSQRSFVTKELADRLGLHKTSNPHRLCGFGDSPINEGQYQALCRVYPVDSHELQLQTKAVVVNRICKNMPVEVLPEGVVKGFSKFKLADPEFWKPGKIDFLLGADLFPSILKTKANSEEKSPSNAIQTIFGLVVMGAMDQPTCQRIQSQTTMLITKNEPECTLSEVVERFWEIEEVAHTKHVNPLDEKCESHFVLTHSRTPSGQYMVRLPFKDTPPDLSSSQSIALHRFYKLEGKLEKQKSMKDEYSRIIKDHETKGYLNVSTNPGYYYLPHHGVCKENSSTSLRIVYDAACETKNGSLNDHLLCGAKLQRDIRDVLMGFRLHVYAMAADICQMFLQILVHPEDRKYQHFIYRFNIQNAITEFELNRLPFGLTCSPYLALRVIQQLCRDEGEQHPKAAAILQTDMYVDDLLTGGDNLEETHQLQKEVISLLSKGGFELKKWCANDKTLLEHVSEEREGILPLSGMEDSIVKILGLQWDPLQDCLSYRIQSRDYVPTKRGIMSIIARMYDPLGYLAPVVFQAKTILQELWKASCDWDAKAPKALQSRWREFFLELAILKKVSIPRYIPCHLAKRVDVIGFADASSDGYAAAIYLRTQENSGNVHTNLIIAKTKLAPLKTQSIPRLELCAALLLSKTLNSISEFLSRIDIQETYLLLDASTVLSWIHTPPHRLKTFVANRVASILELTSNFKWYHVPTGENVADLASRGCSPPVIVDNEIWWKGPTWLTGPEDTWPIKRWESTTELTDVSEIKKDTVLLSTDAAKSELLELIPRVSTFSKLIRIIAYCKRFIKHTRTNKEQADNRMTGPPSLNELDEAKLSIIRCIQQAEFPKNEVTCKTSKLKSLAPFYDSHGTLRVGGRLKNAPLKEEARNPILLPRNGKFVDLLVDHLHVQNLHAGPQLLNAIIRQQYWIIAARNVVRRRVHSCVRCHRLKVKGYAPYMSELPSSRFEQGRAFVNVGIDFAGPFFIKESKRRRASVGKAYMCLFICMSTKAVHCEVVSDLTTEAFLACLDRFIARRGLPQHIFSDNGTNFVGAYNQLKELQHWWEEKQLHEKVEEHLIKREIRWSFNPPQSPHFGGLWEAGIKSFKAHLTRIIDRHPFTFEELATLTSRIEALLNSRPLYPISSDPESYEVLTPGHFLIGSSLCARLEWDWSSFPENRLSRWEFLKQCIQRIWNRWKTDYLHNLQQRIKWNDITDEVKVGTLVLLRDDNTAPLNWSIGRITRCHPGPDGVTRVVDVLTPKATYTRSLTKLSPLLPPPSEPSPQLT